MMNPTKYLFGREVERNAITYFTFLSTSLPNKYLIGFIISFIRSLLTQHIQVILFKESQILSCFCKLALFHSFTDIPVHKCSLTVHQVIFFTDSLAKHSINRRIIANHNHISLRWRNVILLQNSWRFIIQSDFETRWTPIDKRYFFIISQPLNGGTRFFCLHIASVIYTNCHVLIFISIKISNFRKKILCRKTRLSHAANIAFGSHHLFWSQDWCHSRNHKM